MTNCNALVKLLSKKIEKIEERNDNVLVCVLVLTLLIGLEAVHGVFVARDNLHSLLQTQHIVLN